MQEKLENVVRLEGTLVNLESTVSRKLDSRK